MSNTQKEIEAQKGKLYIKGINKKRDTVRISNIFSVPLQEACLSHRPLLAAKQRLPMESASVVS